MSLAWDKFAWGLGAQFVIALAFCLAERRFPLRPQQRFFRARLADDCAYTVLLAFTRLVSRSAFFWLFLQLIWLGGLSASGYRGYGPLSTFSFAWQAVIALVLYDGFDYWMHRLFHVVPALWRIHVIHHQPEEIDALSASRFHPLEALSSRISGLGVLLVGLDPLAIGAMGIVSTVFSCFVHSNLRFRLPYLYPIVTTPRFHRWHHARDERAYNKNYAALFPFWDYVFGTYYRSVDFPRELGDPAIPQGFWAQLKYPFQRSSDAQVRGDGPAGARLGKGEVTQ